MKKIVREHEELTKASRKNLFVLIIVDLDSIISKIVENLGEKATQSRFGWKT